jgi:glycosyl transferase family 2
MTTYALVTPARDEAANLRRLAACVEAQTLPPREWVIVDDGSSDGTSELARELERRHAWVRVVAREPEAALAEARRAGRPLLALEAGIAALREQPEVVVKADADVSVEPGHFERLLAAFAADPRLGIASGSRCEPVRGAWRRQHLTGTSVEAQCRASRGRCLERSSRSRRASTGTGSTRSRRTCSAGAPRCCRGSSSATTARWARATAPAGAVAAARSGVRGAEPLAAALFGRLSAGAHAATGLPPHRPVRWRGGLVSFGAITYHLRALHEYACLTSDRTARELFARGLRTALRAQAADGGWPWLIDARTGAVLERYPLYSVHQLSMSALFLVPALAAGVVDDAGPLDASLAWARGANELGLSMITDEPVFMARAIERRDRWQRPQRYLRPGAAALRRRSGDQAPGRTLRVNRVSHSYEWGWLLLAAAEQAALAHTATRHRRRSAS